MYRSPGRLRVHEEQGRSDHQEVVGVESRFLFLFLFRQSWNRGGPPRHFRTRIVVNGIRNQLVGSRTRLEEYNALLVVILLPKLRGTSRAGRGRGTVTNYDSEKVPVKILL